MATVNLTRLKGRHKKRGVKVFTTDITFDEMTTNADVYQLFTLPPASIVTSLNLLIMIADNQATAATAAIGFSDATLLAATNLKASAGTNVAATLTPLSKPTGGVVTATIVRTGAAATAGNARLTIEYLEYEQCTGELTEFVG
jgi:hypothetical protein